MEYMGEHKIVPENSIVYGLLTHVIFPDALIKPTNLISFVDVRIKYAFRSIACKLLTKSFTDMTLL